ncbi:MAG: hypothetical protein K2K57_10745 [Oscillospiraceae bacterium]|nr:hypothetical protein [Oscillospiraceae bacterium]
MRRPIRLTYKSESRKARYLTTAQKLKIGRRNSIETCDERHTFHTAARKGAYDEAIAEP